ncbi:MAG: SDR family NAD(P)-dependent oxidoreductase [Thermoanaerobaculia bacterium]
MGLNESFGRKIVLVRKIVIVGATGGIAQALCREYAAAGGALTLVGRDRARLQVLADELESAGASPRPRLVPCDLLDAKRIGEATHEALDGGCDLFLYTAAVMPHGDGVTSSFADDGAIFQVNSVAAVQMLGIVANHMREKRSGTIVGISSIAGDRGRKGNPAYCASKAALTAYLEGLRNRLAPYGVRVVTVKPGYVRTRLVAAKKLFWAATPEQAARSIVARVDRGAEVFYVFRRWALLGAALRLTPRFLFKRIGPP